MSIILELLANALSSWLFLPERWARVIAFPLLLLLTAGAIFLIVTVTE